MVETSDDIGAVIRAMAAGLDAAAGRRLSRPAAEEEADILRQAVDYLHGRLFRYRDAGECFASLVTLFESGRP